jgi:acyl homoserine lactone synthase
MSQILVGQACGTTLNSNTLNMMFRFRHKVFYERLGWDVGNENGMERDFYDQLNPIYIVAQNHRNEIEACTRLLPTTGPYMLKNTFPELLRGEEPPHDPLIWELSRFAVLPSNSLQQSQATLSSLTFDMLRSIFHLAQQHGIQKYILVTSAALERLLKRTGLPLYRFENHDPQYVGKVLTVVCWLDVNEYFWRVIYENCILSHQESVAA